MTAETIAGRYVLCDPIGSGGSGTVWRAYDQQRGRYCAAKLLRQRDAGELLRFAREQSVRLDHSHIVSPYAWAADDGMVLIASELIDGGSLQVLLGDYGALAEETVVEILDQVLSALGAVHTAELIHRDVKPGNLLLRATGNGPLLVMLADFGLTISRRDARLTATGMVIGTPGYLPPEVLVGRVSPEPAHDMYAVGRLALALLAGQEIAAAEQDDVPISDSSLREVVHGLLRADPADRPASALAARTMLLGAQRSANPRTNNGDPITVLDQLPLLPDGWGEAGEIRSLRNSSEKGSASAARATLVETARSDPDGSPAGLLVEQATAPTRHGTPASPFDGAAPHDRPVIGLSAPMMSQLITGQRVKISNPAVYGRIVRLEELLSSAVVQRRDRDRLEKLLAEVAASQPSLTTMSGADETSVTPGVDSVVLEQQQVVRWLAANTTAPGRTAAAEAAARAGDLTLAEVLRVAGR